MTQFDRYRITNPRELLAANALDAFFANITHRRRYVVTVAGKELVGVPTSGLQRYNTSDNEAYFHIVADDRSTYRIPVNDLEAFRLAS